MALTLGHLLVDTHSLVPSDQLNVSAASQTTPPKFDCFWAIRQRRTFWKHWRSNYFNKLHIREKWLQRMPNFASGDVTEGDMIPFPGKWPIGRFIQTYSDLHCDVQSVERRLVAREDSRLSPPETFAPSLQNYELNILIDLKIYHNIRKTQSRHAEYLKKIELPSFFKYWYVLFQSHISW